MILPTRQCPICHSKIVHPKNTDIYKCKYSGMKNGVIPYEHSFIYHSSFNQNIKVLYMELLIYSSMYDVLYPSYKQIRVSSRKIAKSPIYNIPFTKADDIFFLPIEDLDFNNMERFINKIKMRIVFS